MEQLQGESLPEAELPAFAKLPAGNSASEPNTLIGQPQEVRMRSPLLVESVDTASLGGGLNLSKVLTVN